MKFTRTFEEINKNDAPIAGGKGASLGEMTRAGFSVPKGFVILSSAFDEFYKLNNPNSPIPIEIAEEITHAFKVLGADLMAVRSSATSEDSATDAWAGQLE